MTYIEYLGQIDNLSRKILGACFKVAPPMFSYARLKIRMFGKPVWSEPIRYEEEGFIDFMRPNFSQLRRCGHELTYRVLSSHGAVNFECPARGFSETVDVITNSQLLTNDKITPEIDDLCKQILDVHNNWVVGGKGEITPKYVFQKLQDKFDNINPYGLDSQEKFNEAVNWIFAETIAETINESRKLSGGTK